MLAAFADGRGVETQECVESKMPPRVLACIAWEQWSHLLSWCRLLVEQVGHQGNGLSWPHSVQVRRPVHLQMTFPVRADDLLSQSPHFLPQGLAQSLAAHLLKQGNPDPHGRQDGWV